jgi:hypothetical protein
VVELYLSLAGTGVAEAICKQLSVWGYDCELVEDGQVQRITARGDAELTSERLHALTSLAIAKEGAIYGCRMTKETGTIERQVEESGPVAVQGRRIRREG